ncbi:hypothetical protein Vadar_007479 [Vaccinium darrowii]|uniref:Uncharacterized protein n=1 Tax=Vaccinium darrowii TaxID=229202 RepID=A0ACB7XPU8_9ERIC|nr:hypothetical protein Vadar_007479 [Vaccinium darrowii]
MILKLGDISEMTFGGRHVIMMMALFSIDTELIYNEFFLSHSSYLVVQPMRSVIFLAGNATTAPEYLDDVNGSCKGEHHRHY